MEIRILGKASGAAKAALHCYFYLAGKGGHAAAGPKWPKGEERNEILVPGDSTQRLLVNISSYKEFEPGDAIRVAGGNSLKLARRWAGRELIWWVDGDVQPASFRKLITGALLAEYEYTAGKGSVPTSLNGQVLTIIAGKNLVAFKAELEHAQAVNTGVRLARDLANAPANELSPEELANRAKAMCAASGLTFKLFKAAQLEKEGYAGLISVGKGSDNPPVLFEMHYKPAKGRKDAQPLCLVGKGITFDTGGISIKPWDGMWDMKADMGGAAAVIGAMQAIALLKPDVPVVGIVASAENMPDGRAYRPGDIIRYKNGRTVEVHSTDAEGRLVLADGLIHAQRSLGLRRIVEFSTLTGACVRALGHQYIGLMSKAEDWGGTVMAAATASGELACNLPLHPEYRALIKSSVADIKNSGGPLAGAQTAALFLYEFIDEGTDYVHMDIAGTFLADKADKYWSQPGATGTGVRLAAELAESLAQEA